MATIDNARTQPAAAQPGRNSLKEHHYVPPPPRRRERGSAPGRPPPQLPQQQAGAPVARTVEQRAMERPTPRTRRSATFCLCSRAAHGPPARTPPAGGPRPRLRPRATQQHDAHRICSNKFAISGAHTWARDEPSTAATAVAFGAERDSVAHLTGKRLGHRGRRTPRPAPPAGAQKRRSVLTARCACFMFLFAMVLYNGSHPQRTH